MSPPARRDSLEQLERLVAALKAKGIVTEEELAARQASTDRASPEIGARMVARAWLDPEWRALLLRDGAAAAERMGVSMAGAPPLGVLEDTPARMNRIGRSELDHGYQRTVGESLDRIAAVTPEDVAALARELLAQPFTTAVVGPFDDEAALPGVLR